jgi:chromosome segregation ATPase
VAHEANGDAATGEAATDVRGRASRRVKRLEERLGQTRTQLDRAKGRRDELEHLLQRMVDTENSRRDHLKAREAEIERQLIEADALRVELEGRLASTERERDEALRAEQEARAELERREQKWRADMERREQEAHAEAEKRERLARSAVEAREKALRDEAVRAEQEARTKAEEGARQARDELARREQDLQAELDAAMARVTELEAQREEASKELREGLQQAQSQVAREQEARAELEGQLAEQHELAQEASKQLVTAVERREELEVAYREVETNADEAKAHAAAAQRRATELERQNERLQADVEEARARSDEEREWQSQLEERLSETEKQAEWVLREVDEELEATLGRTALERERRVAAETELEQVQKSEASLREQVSRLELALSSSESGAEPIAMLQELERAHREIEALQAELEVARSEAPPPAPREPGDLEEEVERLRSELESARVEAETLKWSQEQSRRRILQLEDKLGEVEPGTGGEGEARSETRTRLFGLGGGETRVSRAPLKDPAELPGMSDEELAQAFTSMNEAAKLAEVRGDRESAESHRAMARSIVEEAANRKDFGGTPKVRGRKRNRILRELAAAREQVLESRPLGVGPEASEAGEEPKAD